MLSIEYRDTTHETMSMSDALAAISDEKFVPAPAHPMDVDSYRTIFDLDVLETAEVFEIHASVPGIALDLIDISVFGDGVRIAGERLVTDTGRMTEESDYRWLVRERPMGHFDRSVSLPGAIQADLATATVDDGVLIVTLPKATPASLHVIPVRAASKTHHAAAIEVEGTR